MRKKLRSVATVPLTARAVPMANSATIATTIIGSTMAVATPLVPAAPILTSTPLAIISATAVPETASLALRLVIAQLATPAFPLILFW